MSEMKKTGLGNGCPLYKKCGGCQLQNMTYDQQLIFKQNLVESNVGRFCRVDRIIGMTDPYHYRNKVQAAFKTLKNGKIISGVFQSSSHTVVPVDSCMIEDVISDKIIVTVRSMLKSFKLTAYNEDRQIGFLRHVLVRRGFKSGEVMVVLVTGGPAFPSKNNFIKALLKAHPEITTVVQNINGGKTSLVLGKTQKVLYGKGYIEDELCGCKFRISPSSFYQINPVQTEILYGAAVKLCDIKPGDRVLDAYCGIGTIGLVAASKAKGAEVIGVEVNSAAVNDAKINAKINGIENARFYCRDATDFMQNAAEENIKFDAVFMDPPRAGSTPVFLDSLINLSPERIVYVSCNPETLGRDLKYLLGKSNYKVQKIIPVDMFPHTNHVETVVSLYRLDINS